MYLTDFKMTLNDVDSFLHETEARGYIDFFILQKAK